MTTATVRQLRDVLEPSRRTRGTESPVVVVPANSLPGIFFARNVAMPCHFSVLVYNRCVRM